MSKKNNHKKDQQHAINSVHGSGPVEGKGHAGTYDQMLRELDSRPYDWSLKTVHQSTDTVAFIDSDGPVPIDARTLLAAHKFLMLANKAHDLDNYLKENPTYIAASPELINALKRHVAGVSPARLKSGIDDFLKPPDPIIKPWPHDIDP